MTGASNLAAQSCARIGAGLVNVLSTKHNANLYKSILPPHIIVRDNMNWFDERITARLYGSGGLGTDINFTKNIPTILDADALQPELLTDIPSPERLVLTPHAGEYQRISQGVDPQTFAEKNPSVLVLKGTHTRVFQADQWYHCLGGSTVLARGGSGDLLAGIIGSLLASGNHSSLESALLGVTWHGRAAEVLARQNGQLSVYVTDLLDNLSFAVRNDF